MACNSKQNTITALKDAGIIDDSRVVPHDRLSDYRSMVTRYTNYAAREYGVSGEAIFSLEKKTDAAGNVIYRAIPSESMFNRINEVLEEREDIINEIDYFPAYEEFSTPVVPNYDKYVAYKQNLQSRVETRLNKIKFDKRRFASDKKKLKALTSQENELKIRLEGSEQEHIKGLKAEILELENADSVDKFAYSAERDLDRLAKLVTSINEQDLAEARMIVDFYKALGTFSTREQHPMFASEDIFNSDGQLIIDPKIKVTFEKLKEEVTLFDNRIYQKEKKALEEVVNNNRKVQALYGEKKFTHDELFFKEEGLKDAHWVDMFVMDITNGIYTHNGIIPQVMMNTIQNAFEDHLVYAKSIEDRISNIQKDLEKELKSLGSNSALSGVKKVSYDIFRAINENGQYEDGVTQRYTSKFSESKNKMERGFSNRLSLAKLEEDPDKRAEMFVEAYAARDTWYRKNTVVLDPRKLPEVMNAEDMQQFSHLFDKENSEKYVAGLKGLIGEQGYKEEVKKQVKLIKEYNTMLDVFKDSIIAEAGVESYNDLDRVSLDKIDIWEKINSPFTMVASYRSGKAITKGNRNLNSTMQYNYAVPRKSKTNMKLTSTGVQITETEESTGFYDDRFKVIESNPVLKEFHEIMMEVNQKIFETMPPEMRKKFGVNSIPALERSFVEVLSDSKGVLGFLDALRKMVAEWFRKLITQNAQNEMSHAKVDPITGKPEYKVNSSFLKGNKGVINERYKTELLMFKQAQGLSSIEALSKYDTMDLNKMTPDAIQVLATNLGVAANIPAILARTNADPANFEVGKHLHAGVTNQIVAENSLDLPKILKLYSFLTMQYAARQEVLPVLEMAKRHYEEIQDISKTNMGDTVKNAKTGETRLEGARTQANKQMESWFQRVALGDYSSKGSLTNPKIKRALGLKTGNKKIDAFAAKITPGSNRKLYSSKEKLYKAGLEQILANINAELVSASDLEKSQLMAMKQNVEAQLESLGGHISRTAAVDSLFSFIRFKGLAFNIPSGITNLMEGQISNFTVAASGDYFTPENIYAANQVVSTTITGKKGTPGSRKTYVLMKRYRILQDATNELQKASSKSVYDKVDKSTAYILTQKVEYVNQAPLMIARLMDEKITGKDGTVSNVWAEMQKDGTLKENFATENNKKNWEDADGADYQDFASTMKKMIVNAHGDYDELRGSVASETTEGKAFLMFKRWMSRQFYQRFGTEQADIETGIKDQKGRYKSHTKGSAALHGGIILGATLGLPGLVVGGVVGGVFAHFFGTTNEMNLWREIGINSKEILLNVLKMPINSLAGKAIIPETKSKQKLKAAGVSERDVRNMQSNMVELSILLGFVLLILLTKAALWDDEDEDDSYRRLSHNFIVNKVSQLIGQSAMYINPTEVYESTFAGAAPMRFVGDVMKLSTAVLTGGEPDFRKTFSPSIFREGLGFAASSERQYDDTPFDDTFKSAETLAKTETRKIRQEYRDELKLDETIDEKKRDKMVDKKFPPKEEKQTYIKLLEKYNRKVE